MSVLSYLQSRSAAAILAQGEAASISVSIHTLSTRLSSYFTAKGDGLLHQFRFGSSTRATILPRRDDENSDIDYMVVFEKGGFNPQTYLDRIKRFVEQRYSSSEIYQSSPTIVLELGHIKFDIVPALHIHGTQYHIPNKSGAWMVTDPADFNSTLNTKDTVEFHLIRPVIRLTKIWNAANGEIFESFPLEKWICGLHYSVAKDQQQYLFAIFDTLAPNTGVQWKNDKIIRAKQIVHQVRLYERQGYHQAAEDEVKKLIPA